MLARKKIQINIILFSIDEIYKIIELSNINIAAQLIKVFLYTSCRPSELLSIKTKNVFLDENYMIGGSKTEAGKDRIIPIHLEIKTIIEKYYNTNNEYLITINNKHLSYDSYQKMFDDLMNVLNIEHTPYDTRHTFATKCNEVGIPDVIIKILMGHSLNNDVTNNVYIHRTTEQLLNEVKKIQY